MVSIHVEGLEALRRNLRQLPLDVQANVLSKAVEAGAVVIRDDAKPRVPLLRIADARRIRGLLQRMVLATRGVRRDSEAAAFVTVKRLSKGAVAKFKKASGKGAASNPNDPWYWRFIEFGTSKAAAQPYLRPAFESKKEAAVEAIKKELAAGVIREADKLAVKT